MTIKKRDLGRLGREKLYSPGRPKVAHREQRVLFWRIISEGVSSEEAAVQAGASAPVGSRWFREAGGMPPTQFSKSASSLSGRYLSFAEREEIALHRAQGLGVCAIARKIRRSASTVSRELRRNAATRSGGFQYRATTAQWHADRAAQRPKATKLAKHAALRQYVEDRLSGHVTGTNGKIIPGPDVTWTKRRSVRRQHRRWAIATMAAHRLPCSLIPLKTIWAARARTSGEYFFDVLVIMLHTTHVLEPPTNPGWFILALHLSWVILSSMR